MGQRMGKLSILLIIFITLVTNRVLVAADSPLPSEKNWHYHLIQSLPLPGDGGWDYLKFDDQNRRLYVTHGDRILVLDLDHLQLIGSVGPLQGIHGVALDSKRGQGYVSDGKANQVACFNLKSLSITSRIDVETKPDAIVYEPQSDRVIAFNGGSGSASVIDAASQKVVARLDLGGKPEFAVADGSGKVFVNLEDKNKVLSIDPLGATITASYGVGDGEDPSSLSMDRTTRRLFVGCGNQRLEILDADSGKIVDSLKIGSGVDASVFDEESHLIFHSCGEGVLSIAQELGPNRFSAWSSVPTQKGARTMALDPKNHRAYLVTADFGAPPTPSPEHPHPHGAPLPGTFRLLIVGTN